MCGKRGGSPQHASQCKIHTGAKPNQTTSDPTADHCVLWALEAMLWPLVWICHPTPPLHSEKVMPCSLQDNYRKACEDAKENTDMPPTVLAIVSHCSGPTCPLTSVHLSPSLPSGACEQQRMLLDEPARLSMWSWADPAFG